MESLIKAIEEKIKLSPKLRIQVIDSFTHELLSKGQQFLREDQYAEKLYFLEQGVVRTFYFHHDKEVTSWLYSENQFFTSWYSFIGGHASFEYMMAVEESKVYWITKDKYDSLLSVSPEFEKFGRRLVEEQLSFLEFYFKGFLFMTAQEKYQMLLSSFPDVIQRVNLGYIASLLGITQETLSRIRNYK